MRLHDKTFEISIPHAQIAEAIDALAVRLNDDYRGTMPLLIGVLNGSFMFMSELVQRLDFDCEVSFVKIGSYCGIRSTGVVQELIGLSADVRGRHVLVVEDIVETGRSIEFMMATLAAAEPASVEVATLFLKPELYCCPKAIKYPGMVIQNDFIVGFGLDYDGLGRNLKDIYKVVE